MKVIKDNTKNYKYICDSCSSETIVNQRDFRQGKLQCFCCNNVAIVDMLLLEEVNLEDYK